MTPRIKYEPPPMHESLTRVIPTPAHLAPFVPAHRVSRPALDRIVDPGYQGSPAASEGPHRVRPTIVTAPTPEEMTYVWADRPCPDCAESYTPRAGNQIRCPACCLVKRKADAAKRKRTNRSRTTGPRLLSDRAQKGAATKAINAATRARGRMGELARRRSA